MPRLPALTPLLHALFRAPDRSSAPRRLAYGRLELIPAALSSQGRGSRVQRSLAQAEWLLRDSGSGAYFGTLDRTGRLKPLQRLHAPHPLRQRPQATGEQGVLGALGITAKAATRGGMRLHAEARQLQLAGLDRYRRTLWLAPDAARAWQTMRVAAQAAGIDLQAISGFRSIEYQAAIIRRKLKRGLSLDQILSVNAAPGYSEHHTGRALDIGCPGEPPAEESFEHTAAFSWLQRHAGRFGFSLSYPRNNRHGIVYEPWHWCWHPPRAGGRALPR